MHGNIYNNTKLQCKAELYMVGIETDILHRVQQRDNWTIVIVL